jgi:hypothetical protein
VVAESYLVENESVVAMNASLNVCADAGKRS